MLLMIQLDLHLQQLSHNHTLQSIQFNDNSLEYNFEDSSKFYFFSTGSPVVSFSLSTSKVSQILIRSSKDFPTRDIFGDSILLKLTNLIISISLFEINLSK